MKYLVLILMLSAFGISNADQIYHACAVRRCAGLHRAALQNCRANCWQHAHWVHANK